MIARLVSCLFPVIVGALLAGEPRFLTVGGIQGPSKEIETGLILASDDAREWKPVFEGGRVKDGFTHGNDNLIRGMACGNGLLVAVGNAGIGALVSTDGIHWEFGTPEDSRVGGFCVAFGNGRFLIPTAGTFHTSEDGREWESHNTMGEFAKTKGLGVWGKDGTGHVRQVISNGSVFVFKGERQIGSTADGRSILWHQQAEPGRERLDKYPDFAAGAGRFILLGNPSAGAPSHLTSTDGVNWEPLVIGSDEAGAVAAQQNILWTGSHFRVAGKDEVHVSRDGLEWELAPGCTGAANAASGDLLVRKGHRQLHWSDDNGATWQTVKEVQGVRQVFGYDGRSILGGGGG